MQLFPGNAAPFLRRQFCAHVEGACYGLFGAGVIDNRLQLTVAIDANEDADNEAGLTEETARASFMHLYAGLLAMYLDDHDVDAQARVLASDHLRHATEWLIENGHTLAFGPASAVIN